VSFPATPRRPDAVRLWIPPRGDVPGRPDAPLRPDRRGRGRRWIGPVAVVSAVALVALVVVVTTSIHGGIGENTERPGTAIGSPGDGYAFLATRLEGGRRVPVRWNPCEPIHYQVNLDGAPEDALDEIRRASDRVTDATGIPFAYDGTTDRTMEETGDDAFLSDIWTDTYFPVLIAWIPHDRMVKLTEEGVLAFAHPEAGGSEHPDQWASGWVILDAGGRFEPAGRYSVEEVLMHELGHLVGLAHVADPDELMWSDQEAPDTRPFQMYDWGDGDRDGLDLLGADQGCKEHVSVQP
jgi:Matrixin